MFAGLLIAFPCVSALSLGYLASLLPTSIVPPFLSPLPVPFHALLQPPLCRWSLFSLLTLARHSCLHVCAPIPPLTVSALPPLTDSALTFLPLLFFCPFFHAGQARHLACTSDRRLRWIPTGRSRVPNHDAREGFCGGGGEVSRGGAGWGGWGVGGQGAYAA